MNPNVPPDVYSALAPWLIALIIVLGLLLVAWMERVRRLVASANAYRERHAATIDNLAEGVYTTSFADGRMISANKALVAICGFDDCSQLIDSVNGPDHHWYVEPGRQAVFRSALERDGVVRDFVSQVCRHETGERFWVHEQARIIRDDKTGEPIFYVGSVRDITPEISRKQAEERLYKLANNLPGGLFQLVRHADGTFACPYASDSFATVFGLQDAGADFDPNDQLSRINPADLPAYLRSLHESAMTLDVWNHEFRCRLETGVTVWLQVTATPERLADGDIIWHGYISDVSERKAAEDRIHRLAHYDSLTELPNRRLLVERLEAASKDARRRGEYSAVLFLDLDNFKELNDTRGHEAGDTLLRLGARRLRESVREDDTVGRYGGDEFMVLLCGLGSDRRLAEERAASSARSILSAFSGAFDLLGEPYVATPSIGCALFDGAEAAMRDIIRDADLAMYQAKKSGRNGYVIFQPRQDGGTQRASA